jgi:argininosuccinate lyase
MPPDAAPELIESAFVLETSYAGVLHEGLNLADLAHVLDLRARRVIPDDAAATLLAALLDIDAVPADQFPYDPLDGEPYNSRERVLVERIGTVAGWLHAGRPRREATRVAFRLYLRRAVAALAADAATLAAALSDQATATADVLFPDQTYLQQAQPSTVGHYLLSFAYPVLRDGGRLLSALDWVDRSPGGAGCVNGTGLRSDREGLADLLGFGGVITNTRDAMWQTDGLIELLAASASLVTTQDALAEDLEIWSSNEFDFVGLADGYSRASVLMPQKRNPYALSIIRGATAVLIGRLTGFLALQKGPSARSDKLIFAYTEVPGALDLTGRTTRLTGGVVATLSVNAERMGQALAGGFSQATDLAEHVMAACGLDYRTAYQVVGAAVRRAAAEGRRAIDLTADELAVAAKELTGSPIELDPDALARVLDPAVIVATRTGTGGAAPGPMRAMLAETSAAARQLGAAAHDRIHRFDQAAAALRAAAREGAHA